MPEEINRILTDALADYLFVTEEGAIEHLLKEGRPRSSIFMVGNVMIDSLLHFLPIAQQSRIGDDLGLKNGEIGRASCRERVKSKVVSRLGKKKENNKKDS